MLTAESRMSRGHNERTIWRSVRSLAKNAMAGQLWRHALISISLIAMLYPLVWMVGISLLPDSALATMGLIPTGQFTYENYPAGWHALSVSFGRFFMNSSTVAFLSVLGNLFSCSLTAYAIARLRFRLQKAAFALIIVTLLVPFHAIIIPQYILFAQAGVLNTFIPLVMPKLLATDAFFVFLMIQFIRGLPRDLDEAALLDGAGRFRIYWSIIVPLMRPVLATTAIFTLIWTWNDFFGPLVYLTSIEKFTVPVALNALSSADSGLGTTRLFAMAVLALAPLLVFFSVAQRHIVEGIASTGMK